MANEKAQMDANQPHYLNPDSIMHTDSFKQQRQF
jgi:hypothetical protein